MSEFEAAIVDALRGQRFDGFAITKVSTVALRAWLKRAGFWFVDVRLWAALRRLERMRVVSISSEAGGPERGYFARNMVSLEHPLTWRA